MRAAILIFDRLTALDAVGPYEVLSRVPGWEVTFVGDRVGEMRTDAGSLGLIADATFEDLPDPDILVVPGGPGRVLPLGDARAIDWVRSASETAQWTTSVCTGALLLGAAGLLEGRPATTHWMYRDQLAGYGAEVRTDRVVVDGTLVTAAGVSAGIDMALHLVAEAVDPVEAQMLQLAIEYDPVPPFDAGSPEKAPPAVVEALRARYAAGAVQADARARARPDREAT